MEELFSYIEQNRETSIRRLQDFCRQESVSAQNKGIDETAALVERMLSEIGAKTRILSVPGAKPAVYGEIKGASDRTLLFYNHYDVQPPEPLEEWVYPPFLAEIKDGILYARGCADNKGDLLARILAVKTLLETGKELPVTVKFFVEGEEEIGSPHIEDIINGNPEIIQADGCIWEMGRKTFDNKPVINLGIKGMLYVELTARGANTDSHSSLATTIPNPAWKLVWALGTLKDKNENILIEGFYDGIDPIGDDEIIAIKEIPDEDALQKKNMGIDNFLLGLSGFERVKRDITAPTCTICGIESGYTGEGSKTVLPAKASVKIDFRLVPGQDPSDILEKLRRHLNNGGFTDIEINPYTMEKAFKTPIDSKLAKVVAETAESAYGRHPAIYPSMPGTGPMYHVCGPNKIPCVGTGITNAKSAIHAPNENVLLEDFIEGIKHIVLIIQNF